MGIYETWITSLRLSWMGTTARKIMGGFAAALGDRTADPDVGWMRQALLERLPLRASRASVDMMAVDRGIELGLSETDASAAERVARAVVQSRLYGTPLGMLVALEMAGYTGATIVQQNGRYHRIDGTPQLDDLEDLTTQPSWYTVSNLGNGNPAIPASTDGKVAIAALTIPWWSFGSTPMDSATNQYNSRFGLIWFSDRLPAGWSGAVTPPTSGSTPSKAAVNQIIRIVNRWRPAKAAPQWLRVVTSGHVYDEPGIDYDDPGLTYAAASAIVDFSATTEYA
jgi:hypothetical protein